jgi:predicted nucleotidyltransferase
LDVTARLNRVGADCALIGGLAVSTRAEPRFTRDVDLAVSVTDDSAAESLVRHLVSKGFVVLAVVEQEAVGRLATVRLVPPGQTEEGVVVDLLFASSGIESEIVRAADQIELFPGVVVAVATTAHLIALKVLACDEKRPQDEADLRSLLLDASDADIAGAEQALNLVTERGFDRGRDLAAALEAAISRWQS